MTTYKRHFTIPDSFESDLKAVMAQNPPPKGFKVDHAYFWVHLIVSLPKYSQEYLSKDGYTLLMYKYLKKDGISNPKLIKDYLIENGLILCDDVYRVWDKAKKIDGKAYGYRMAEKYKWLYCSIECNDVALNRRYSSTRVNMEFKYRINHNHLVKNLKRLTFDLESMEAELYYKLIEDNSESTFKKPRRDRWDLGDFVSNAEHKFGAAYSVLERLKNNDIFYKIDDNGKRFHSNLTSMPSYFRKHITFEGERLSGHDIRNSQPYFATLLFKKEFWFFEKSKKANSIFQSLITYNPTIFNYINTTTLPLMRQKMIQSFDKQDVKDFIKLAESGQFYKYLKERIENHPDPRVNKYSTMVKDYRLLKEMIFIVMFSHNSFINRESKNGFEGSELKDLFSKLFPTVYEVFALIKKDKKENLALLLQNIESYAIIEKVTRRIAKERPDLLILTIHDSVITTEGNEEYLQSIMEEELSKIVGFPPKLKPDKWFNEYSDLDCHLSLPILKEMAFKMAA